MGGKIGLCQLGWATSTQGLGDACGFSANPFRVLISLPHTSLGLRVVKSLPHAASP